MWAGSKGPAIAGLAGAEVACAGGASCTTNHPMVKNKFVVEVGDTEQLKQCISRLRNVESVFDAYRVTPTG